MNEMQQKLIQVVAQVMRLRPEDITQETRLGYTSHAVATWFSVIHQRSLVVNDIENCTVNDLLQQLT